MTPILIPWLELALCAGLIGLAGPLLVRYGDVIARLTGLTRSWIGLVLLATATSLPELFTGISSVAVAAVPNIAVGDALGSCVFNLAMIVLLDEMSRDEPMYRRIDQGHILTAGFGIVLIGAVGAMILLSRDGLNVQILHISIYTPLIVVLYFVAMRAAFTYERRAVAPPPKIERDDVSLRRAVWCYTAAAMVVVAAGTWLPFIGSDIAAIMGWRTTFVGTLLIAAATSIPELVVTISALRLKAADMAIANLLGSNLFDMLVLAVDDVAYIKGPLLSSVSPAHAITAFAAVIMSGIFIVAMLYKPETRIRGTIGWVSLGILMVYFFSAYAVYLMGS
ncbi:sodium:calcium antiporter [Taklimakanibacter lacteus]|uniref:sodium:calcium antiporter n=1 Tax=Taklimakanibacter lacteus TaxID=2268456 RepID=UPI000E662ED3